MTIIIYIVGVVLFLLGLTMRVDLYGTDNQKKYGIWVMQVCLLSLVWNTVSYNLFKPEEKWCAGSIQLVGNTVCTSYNGNIINLNTQTGCNFMPGDFVVVKSTEGQWFLGVYYPGTTKFYHWKELPTGMSAVKPPEKKVEEESNDA